MNYVVKNVMKIIVILMSCAALLLVYARYIEPNLLIAVTQELEANRLTKDLKVVFFADTHIGSLYDETKLEKLVNKINDQGADFVIFGGDFFDTYEEEKGIIDIVYVTKQLSTIEATQGKIAVWGNHDKGGGHRIYEKVMEDSGFLILENEDFYVEEYNLCIRGLDDYLLGTPDLDTSTLDESYYNLVVVHEPDITDEMNRSKVDLMLAGHSHGGQIFVPGLTAKLLPPGATKYVSGLYDISNVRGTYLYVTKGVGVTKLPYRFMNVPEIVVLELEAGF